MEKAEKGGHATLFLKGPMVEYPRRSVSYVSFSGIFAISSKQSNHYLSFEFHIWKAPLKCAYFAGYCRWRWQLGSRKQDRVSPGSCCMGSEAMKSS
jgi:hypothetical protein